MRYRIKTLFAASVPFVALLAAPSVATALTELPSCGGVFVSGGANCQFVKTQDCSDHCEVVSVEQSCAAELYTSCETECTTDAGTTCTGTCQPVCVEECTVAAVPESSDDICNNHRAGDCDSKCAGAENGNRCHAACSHTWGRKCGERCRHDDGAVNCGEKCVTACDGSCTSTSDTTCQINCQTNSFQNCETTTVERCHTECTNRGGAIFCDGQFLNASDLESCASDLMDKVSINVDISAAISVAVNAQVGTKTAAAKDKAGCSLGMAPPRNSGAWATAALLAGAVLLRRRRQSRTGSP
jgi:MYXO-CTERM domain-containing protein